MDLNELNDQLAFDTTPKPIAPKTMPHTRGVARRSKVTSITLKDEHQEILKRLGNGNVSRGIKRLLSEHIKNNA